ncbi:hypothetical protein ECHHL_0516 [Ehrlichia chaffeensis str. Heartland]|nr:hypothetical protein ECHHL_0516 [Ehrlichia chaffeensis str. Heartland]AHX06595.1 hypothetical protein ECHLIB_0542 [Ehrlichia chaffeensis str. Liberty]AHX07245.1 hypothetical protein ECHOSC_0524 [Ehrlichia chaffeensis str. Osceola]AHX08487.1 hypothetical protein ECHSTV_0530 [Ehrlichia chaffeensis str. Saint Vincent]AHX09433.1 hypothetical protein ECHWAK_0536 [Ehrlichia chaffeensis str. Wakulla]AHX10132.1 hypothetical protein ECHWP_0513 [Ehrlichia chaffeensis str. West Paces]
MHHYICIISSYIAREYAPSIEININIKSDIFNFSIFWYFYLIVH